MTSHEINLSDSLRLFRINLNYNNARFYLVFFALLSCNQKYTYNYDYIDWVIRLNCMIFICRYIFTFKVKMNYRLNCSTCSPGPFVPTLICVFDICFKTMCLN